MLPLFILVVHIVVFVHLLDWRRYVSIKAAKYPAGLERAVPSFYRACLQFNFVIFCIYNSFFFLFLDLDVRSDIIVLDHSLSSYLIFKFK